MDKFCNGESVHLMVENENDDSDYEYEGSIEESSSYDNSFDTNPVLL